MAHSHQVSLRKVAAPAVEAPAVEAPAADAAQEVRLRTAVRADSKVAAPVGSKAEVKEVKEVSREVSREVSACNGPRVRLSKRSI